MIPYPMMGSSGIFGFSYCRHCRSGIHEVGHQPHRPKPIQPAHLTIVLPGLYPIILEVRLSLLPGCAEIVRSRYTLPAGRSWEGWHPDLLPTLEGRDHVERELALRERLRDGLLAGRKSHPVVSGDLRPGLARRGVSRICVGSLLRQVEISHRPGESLCPGSEPLVRKARPLGILSLGELWVEIASLPPIDRIRDGLAGRIELVPRREGGHPAVVDRAGIQAFDELARRLARLGLVLLLLVEDSLLLGGERNGRGKLRDVKAIGTSRASQ